MTEIKFKLVDGEPVCNLGECPTSHVVVRTSNSPHQTYCRAWGKPYRPVYNSTSCIPGLCQQRERQRTRADAAEAKLGRMEAEQEIIFAAISDVYDIEDWTNPEKGITELEAHCNALGNDGVCRTPDHSPDVFNGGDPNG